jgi:hypothetical protein
MIRRFFKTPRISYNFRTDPDKYSGVAFWLEIAAKGKGLASESFAPNFHGWSTETLSHLAGLTQQRSAIIEALDSLGKQRSVVEKSSSSALVEHVRTVNSLERQRVALLYELLAYGREMATPEFLQHIYATPIPLKPSDGDDSNDDRCYALYRGTVWSSDRSLEPDQWAILAYRFIEREDAELKAALAVEEPDSGRERLTPEVRRAVWARDQGKCARCGSRERLEFDHIIPVSRGGANTERNIELLCEVCNRAKSDSVE